MHELNRKVLPDLCPVDFRHLPWPLGLSFLPTTGLRFYECGVLWTSPFLPLLWHLSVGLNSDTERFKIKNTKRKKWGVTWHLFPTSPVWPSAFQSRSLSVGRREDSTHQRNNPEFLANVKDQRFGTVHFHSHLFFSLLIFFSFAFTKSLCVFLSASVRQLPSTDAPLFHIVLLSGHIIGFIGSLTELCCFWGLKDIRMFWWEAAKNWSVTSLICPEH